MITHLPNKLPHYTEIVGASQKRATYKRVENPYACGLLQHAMPRL
jgi:hypothetical protein